MSDILTETRLTLKASLSSSKTRYGGRHNSISLYVGGFHLAWLDANGDRWHEVAALLGGHSKATSHGQSGSKYTIDPKYSWSGYNLDEEASDRTMRSLFGTTVVDELNRRLSQKEWIIFKGRYCLPREKLNRFISSGCRDKTWCDAVRFKDSSPSLVGYLRSISGKTEDDDIFGEIRIIKAPKPPARERMRWRCEECGHEGHREAFRERSIPGLAGSTGLNCPTCDYRSTDAITGLLVGPVRGDVRRLPSSIMYPAA